MAICAAVTVLVIDPGLEPIAIINVNKVALNIPILGFQIFFPYRYVTKAANVIQIAPAMRTDRILFPKKAIVSAKKTKSSGGLTSHNSVWI
jgi:hypothetical protein